MTLALVLSMVLSQGYAPPRQGQDPLDVEREARVQRVGKLLRCAVCQGVSIADSPASMARAQLDKVRELVAAGKSDDEIYEYFVERYGEWALMEPRKAGVALTVWVAPLLALVIGLFLVFGTLRRPGTPASPAPPVDSVSDDFLDQVRKDLEK